MPAQNVKQITNFNGNFQAAVQSILKAAGYADTFIERGRAELPESRIEVSFSLGEAMNETQLRNGDLEYDFFSGRLRLRIVTVRPDDQPSLLPGVDGLHSEWSAGILATFRESQKPFTAANLPFYTVRTIRPLSVTPDLDPRWLEDFTAIELHIEFGIRADAWPL